MKLKEVRKKYIEFFLSKKHVEIPSSSLIPEGDSTTLFTGSGMQPLLPYLLGKTHDAGVRLVNSQKSFRAEDIEEVGDNRHTTFFEMLGNWSLGDYTKEEQIPWFFQFLTDEIGLDPDRLYVTVFSGSTEYGIPEDTESGKIWQSLFKEKGISALEARIGTEEAGYERGIKEGERIFYYGKKNWWSRSGSPEKMPAREPGGPDSEVFFEFKEISHDLKYGKICHPNCDCGRFMEIGNSVFMEYIKTDTGKFEKLSKPNIDFGGGLERITAVVNGTPDVFQIDVFSELMTKLEENISSLEARRVVADHLRSSVFLIADGVYPGNKDRGYVLRRLMRRLLLRGYQSNLKDPTWLTSLVRSIIDYYQDIYPELGVNQEKIQQVFLDEARKFFNTLELGLKEFNKIEEKIVTGAQASVLATSYGFPVELTCELAKEKGMEVDLVEYYKETEKHKEISRAGAQKKFGGHGLLLDTGELKAKDEEELIKVTRLHTATHLMQSALREVLGPEVKQAGSDITAKRTRFDFNLDRRLTDEEISQVEAVVNREIEKNEAMQYVELPKEEAEKTGALYFFKNKYGNTVKVYYSGSSVKDAFTKEFCGGPHVTKMQEVGRFKILKQESVGSGVRRIRADVE